MGETPTVREFQYIGQSYRQGASPIEVVSFCATAGDIRRWGGVPAKTERFHGGFQRALGDRYKRIKQYFDDAQVSPTSVVVAFRQGALHVSPLGYPGSWTAAKQLSYNPTFVHISFSVEVIDPADFTLGSLRERVCKILEPRLAKSPPDESPDEQEAETDNDDNGEDVDSSDEVADDEEETPELDVGHSKLNEFYKFLSDPDKIKAWLTNEQARFETTKAKLKKTRGDTEFLQALPEDRLKQLLVSLLRPAMIVDGQHRVWGADHSDRAPIPFTVCALTDADWIEQVFQFVVINKLAKPISPGFLTSILNTSLTNAEVTAIEVRLDSIGIRNTDRVIMKYLNLDPRSPFRDLIAAPGEVAGVDNKGKLSDKGMIRLAKRWLNIRRDKKAIEMFQPALKAKNKTEARTKWSSYETWFPYFYAFWSAIKDRYSNDGIWEKRDRYHLLYIVTMHAMQDMFIDAKSSADGSFSSIEDFSAQVTSYFKDVPATFFQNWEATGLQSGEGPDWIREAITQLRSGTRLATLQDASALFQKPTKGR